MSHKYYSRSPQELKDYLENLNQKNKKKSWFQIIIFLDIVILLIAFFAVSSKLSTGTGMKVSTKLMENGIESYFAKSGDRDGEDIIYFLFITNKGKDSIKFPPENSSFEYNLFGENGLVCNKSGFEFSEKEIKTGTTEFYTFKIPRFKKEKFPEACELNSGKGLFNFKKLFSNKNSHFSELKMKSKTGESIWKMQNEGLEKQ
jgi:hypothetical protein